VDEHAEALIDVVAEQLLHGQGLGQRRRRHEQEGHCQKDDLPQLTRVNSLSTSRHVMILLCCLSISVHHGVPLTATSASPAGCPVKLTRTKPMPLPKVAVAVRVWPCWCSGFDPPWWSTGCHPGHQCVAVVGCGGKVSCTELTVYVLSRDTYHQGAVSVVAACQEVVVSPSLHCPRCRHCCLRWWDGSRPGLAGACASSAGVAV